MDKFKWNSAERCWYGPPKDPNDEVDYVVDFVNVIGSDTISSQTITVSGGTLAQSSQAGSRITVWLSSGVLNTPIEVDIQINTSSGRKFSRRFKVNVENL